jgi:putative transposase
MDSPMVSGRKQWLWRAVDPDGHVLDEIVQARRDTKAAKRLMIRLLKTQGLTPKPINTCTLRSYGATKRDLMPTVQRSHKGPKNRAEIPAFHCGYDNGQCRASDQPADCSG